MVSASRVDMSRCEVCGTVLSECSFGERRSVIEEILTGVILRRRKTLEQSGRKEGTGSIGCPETSVRNYPHSLRNSPEERSSHLQG